MDADDNKQCACELCQPNWYLGDMGEFHPAVPAPAATVKVESEQPTDAVMFQRIIDAMSTGLHAH